MLPMGEMVHADLGYVGEPNYIVTPNQLAGEAQRIAKSIRARHETVNKRFKQFEILKRVFRHSVHHHQPAFGACVVITQMSIENGEPLYAVDYREANL